MGSLSALQRSLSPAGVGSLRPCQSSITRFLRGAGQSISMSVGSTPQMAVTVAHFSPHVSTYVSFAGEKLESALLFANNEAKTAIA